MWTKLGSAGTHIHVSSDVCYAKVGAKGPHNLVRAVNMKFNPDFPNLLSDLGKIQYKRSTHKYTEC